MWACQEKDGIGQSQADFVPGGVLRASQWHPADADSCPSVPEPSGHIAGTSSPMKTLTCVGGRRSHVGL